MPMSAKEPYEKVIELINNTDGDDIDIIFQDTLEKVGLEGIAFKRDGIIYMYKNIVDTGSDLKLKDEAKKVNEPYRGWELNEYVNGQKLDHESIKNIVEEYEE